MTLRMPSIVSIAFAVLTVGPAACSSGSGGGAVGNPNASPSQAASDVANALCARYAACSSFFIKVAYGDTATCASRVELSITAAMGAKGTGRTPANVEACGAAIANDMTCDDLLGNNLPAPCQAVKGTLADGTACFDSSQCQSAYCNLSGGQTCGACGPAPTAGATCTSDGECPGGTVCGKDASGNGACVTPAAAGASCDAAHPCRTSLVCNGGTCGPRLAAGQSCAMNAQGCDTLAGTFCNPGTTTCATVGLAAPGQPCGLVGAAYVTCSGGGNCKLSGTGASGTCTAPAADGASCDDANGPSCMGPSTCTNGTCVAPSASACM